MRSRKFRLVRVGQRVVAAVPRLCLSPDRRCSHDRTGRERVSGDAVGRGSRGRGHPRRTAGPFTMMLEGSTQTTDDATAPRPQRQRRGVRAKILHDSRQKAAGSRTGFARRLATPGVDLAEGAAVALAGVRTDGGGGQAPGGSAREAGTGERWGARNGDRGLIHNALVSAADGRLQRLLRADDTARPGGKAAPRLSAVKALR